MSDEDEHAEGRPYGGVAIACRNIDGVTYEAIQCQNRNIIGVLLNDLHGTPIHIVLCVYMPYYDKSWPSLA